MSVPPSAWACCSCSKKTGAVAPGGAVISCIRSSPCRELRRSLVFEPHDILRRDVEIPVVVERVGDGGGDQAREGHGGQPPIYQIRANPSTVLNPARTTPAPVFFGMWIGLKPPSGLS